MTEARGAFAERVYAVVKRVPEGRVISYGDVAVLAGSPSKKGGLAVGNCLEKLAWEVEVPWWRVLPNTGATSRPPHLQWIREKLLKSEGVEIGEGGVVDWKKWGALIP